MLDELFIGLAVPPQGVGMLIHLDAVIRAVGRSCHTFLVPDYYGSGGTFAATFPGFEQNSVVGVLDADPTLFAPKAGEDDAATAQRLIEVAFSVMPRAHDRLEFVFGLGLLAAAAALAIMNGRSNPDEAVYPQRRFYVHAGWSPTSDDLKRQVYAMARAIATRVTPQP